MMHLSLSNGRRALGIGLLLCGLLALGPATGAAPTLVKVDQAPLIAQQPLAPNITLMLDDSGSMAWDYMPDFSYLTNTKTGALVDAANNGVYYNPTITYSLPATATGGTYPAPTGLTSAWVDGFASPLTAVNLTTYDGRYDTGSIPYSSTQTGSQSTTYTNVASKSACQALATAPNSTAAYTASSKTCVVSVSKNYNVFQYATGPAAGPYTMYYVAATDCGSLANCVTASDQTGAAAPAGVAAGQNIAIWFTYYHTRILMAKSGLMNAFANIDATYRVGFGSIDGGNMGGLPAATYSYYDTYNSQTNYIAQVQPFGDGSAGTQRAAFWSWISGEQPQGGTPLRQALDQVGQYYSTAQPWQTSTSDTTELACRQSYTILTTDGFWNENFSIANQDGVSGPTIQGPNGQSYTYTAVAPYADTQANTLADVAMKYWKTDLRTGDANEVLPSSEDPAFWQHMSTFTMGLGFVPTGITPTGTTISQIFSWANGGAAISNFSWPKPASNSINNIADLAHAAVNGHGGFYSATSPSSFVSGLTDALKRAAERIGSGASLAANSTQLQTGTVTYQANYYTAKWKGDLSAYTVNPNTGVIATNPTWTASSMLPAAASRTIYTYNPTSQATVTFTTANLTSLSSAEQAALGSTPTVQANMINYLRGDPALELKNTNGIYRNRDTPLGDIVNSQPIYVGDPSPNQFFSETFTGSSSYATYVATETGRTPLIFVAANDGMLHAFNATTGAEVYAYIPGATLANNLAGLSDPNYGTTTATPHQYYNDGELTVADVYMNSAWHTILVGTTGRGTTRAVYALDVTNPAAFNLLWERSANDGLTNSTNIGQMVGKPVIALTADSSSGSTWSVLIGNGYNSGNGQASLLQFALADGTLNVHTVTDTSSGNGLAAPAAWMGAPNNGVSTVAYAGDLHGQVWQFSLNNGTAGTPSSTGALVFTAVNAQNQAQPITAGMLMGQDPTTLNVWLFFGTGQYLSSTDLTNTQVQSWYGLIVQSSTAKLVSNLASQGRAALGQRTIVAETAANPAATPPLPAARSLTADSSTTSLSGLSGWYYDLVSPLSGNQGERMVTPNQFQGNLLLGVSRIPLATDPCNPSGSGWIMAVNPFTGTGPSSDFFDLNGDGSVNSQDRIGGANGAAKTIVGGLGFNSLPNNPIFVGSTMLNSFDNGTKGNVTTNGSTGSLIRVSWRELVNP